MRQLRISPMFRFAAAVATLLFMSAAVPANHQDESAPKLSVITFTETPSVQTLEQLEAKGVELGQYLGKGSYYVYLKNGQRLALPASIRIRSAVAEDKYRLIDTILNTSGASRIVTLRAYFAEGTEFSSVRALVEINGGTVKSQEWEFGTTSVLISLPVSSIEKAAASNRLLAIAPEIRKRETNINSAIRSHIDTARNEYGLTGKNINVAIVDGGEVYTDHPDFGGRVQLAETSSKSTHSTHVTGTILGSGENNANAKGMAVEANGISFNFNSSISKFYRAVDEFAARVINNSWGGVIGWDYNRSQNRWEFNDNRYLFGAYLSQTQEIDRFIKERNAAVVYSAGNDRNDGAPADGNYWKDDGEGGFEEVTNDPNPPSDDGPYRTVDVYSSAKNIITVGATDINDVMSSFSSWGPTADGRIKPDVVAKGVSTISPYNEIGYFSQSGTSMSAPVVSGGAVLLIEQFMNYQDHAPTPHELKGLICTTAKDLGNAGPDYSFGFGLLDVQKAAELIERDDDENTILLGSIRKLKKAKRNKPVYYQFSLPSGVHNLRVALAWTDPEGPAARFISEIIDGQDPVLMNDLDLRLYWIKQRKKRDRVIEYEPYILNPDNPSATAKRGDNRIDNIELVEIKNPKKGDWFIEVSAGTFKNGSSQDFALIVYADKTISSPVEETDQPEALQDN